MVKEKSFNKMTPSEKRVTLARDVIAQVKAKKLLPKSGTYCAVLKDTGKLVNAKCEVCGIGALFVSHMLKTKPDLKVDTVLLHNEEYDEDVVAGDVDSCDIEALLKGVFSSKQLADIEDAFEQMNMNYGAADPEAQNFFVGLDLNAEERLALIMENIIANRGTFRVDRRPETRVVTPGYGG